MTETVEQMVSRIDERTKHTKDAVKDIKDLLADKCVSDEEKFSERPTRKELLKAATVIIVGTGALIGAVKVAAMIVGG